MTIKDILVGLATQDETDLARDFGLATAAHYRAHVTEMLTDFPVENQSLAEAS